MDGGLDPFGLIGQVLDGQFRVDKYVGEGGFSVVYKGHHLGLAAPIAIKCLKLPVQVNASLVESFMHRFRDESRLYYQLSQGNLSIVRSISSGTAAGPHTGATIPYMILEWLEGRSLAQDFEERRIRRFTGRTLDEMFELFSGAADGIGYAHAQGVVHRDMNPGNIFIVEDKGQKKTKVLDFGVAKILRDHTLELGARAQTLGAIRIFAPAYGAPEQFDDRVGEVGPWTDVYGFSLMIMEALRDKTVMEGEHIGDYARQALNEDFRPTPRALGLSVPDEIEQVFARSFKISPKDRWQNAQDFWIVFRNAIRMAKHKGFGPTETVPLSSSFLKKELEKKTSERKIEASPAPVEQPSLASTFAMAPTPAAPSVDPGPGPNTRRLAVENASTVPAPALLNATLAMGQRPVIGIPGISAAQAQQIAQVMQQSAAPVQPQRPPPQNQQQQLQQAPQGVAQPSAMPMPMGQPTSAPALDDGTARPSYGTTMQIKNGGGGGKIVLIALGAFAFVVLLGGLAGFMLYRRSHAISKVTAPSASVSAMLSAMMSASPIPSTVPTLPADAPDLAPSATTTTSASASAPTESASAAIEPAPTAITAPTATATATATATTTATATATTTAAATATATTTATTAPRPSASAADPNAFSEKVARGKLDTFGGMVGGGCHEAAGVSGPGMAHVTFGNDGKVSGITVDPPYAGTKQGDCVTGLLRRATAPAFQGAPGTVNYKFNVDK